VEPATDSLGEDGDVPRGVQIGVQREPALDAGELPAFSIASRHVTAPGAGLGSMVWIDNQYLLSQSFCFVFNELTQLVQRPVAQVEEGVVRTDSDIVVASHLSVL
jgi:hypothetical protein